MAEASNAASPGAHARSGRPCDLCVVKINLAPPVLCIHTLHTCSNSVGILAQTLAMDPDPGAPASAGPFANTGELLAELGQTQPRHITALREWREQARRSRWSMATWWRKQQSITKGKAYDSAIALETWKEMKKTQYETTFKRWLASTVLQETPFGTFCRRHHFAGDTICELRSKSRRVDEVESSSSGLANHKCEGSQTNKWQPRLFFTRNAPHQQQTETTAVYTMYKQYNIDRIVHECVIVSVHEKEGHNMYRRIGAICNWAARCNHHCHQSCGVASNL